MHLNVAFMWHMHQPLYTHPEMDTFVMPWVRLHGVKAYNDMIGVLEETGDSCDIGVTFNLVPSLVFQLQHYEHIKDQFAELSLRRPEDLSASERAFILRHFFSCHWPTMVEPYERYRQLLENRGRDLSSLDTEEIISRFNDDDIRDLQVWFNLTWLGFHARKDPFVKGLFKKGRLFTEEEKKGLLDLHRKILKELVDRYRVLWDDGRIDISTSPFYHPILPLLFDTECAKRSMPNAVLPTRFSFPEDVKAQLRKARDYMAEQFGRAPSGLWPSEGSVSPEIISIAEEVGFRWAATDQGILKRSLGRDPGLDLFEPFLAIHDGGRLQMVFRHHELSDLIGFVYKKADPRVAVRDLHLRLKEIKQGCEDGGCSRSPLCVIILDGENPWEHYQDGGEGLLRGIYTKIAQDPGIRLVTISDYLAEYPPTRTLENIYTGSWINSNFSIWIGGQEENAAWEELLSARLALSRAREKGTFDPSTLDRAMEWIYAAEGSDWFWWYGDQFHSDFTMVFDSLFRSYLKKVYAELGETIPESLKSPIKREKTPVKVQEPMGFIDPEIDGRLSSFWEWVGAGTIQQETLGSMYKKMYLKGVSYGFNIGWLFIKAIPFDGFEHWRNKGREIKITIKGIRKAELSFKEVDMGQGSGWVAEVRLNGHERTCDEIGVRWGIQDIVEVAVPFGLLGSKKGEEIGFFVEVLEKGITMERWPQSSFVTTKLPDKDFERRLWLI